MIDILILGPGRSGTSTTARILHDRFRVCFGHHPLIGLRFHGDPMYEHPEIKRALHAVTHARERDRDIHWWHDLVLEDHSHARCSAPLIGVKLLDLALLRTDQILSLDPRLIVRTIRGRESCVRAWMRYNPSLGRSRAQRYVDARERGIERIMSDLDKLETATFLKRARLHFDPEQNTIPDARIARVLSFVVPFARERSERFNHRIRAQDRRG